MIPGQEQVREFVAKNAGGKIEREVIEHFLEPKDDRKDLERTVRAHLIRLGRGKKLERISDPMSQSALWVPVKEEEVDA